MISFDDLSVSQIQVQLTERDQLKNEVVVLQKQLEKKIYSGFGPSNAPFGTKWAMGVYSGWRDGTASECIIPEGWREKYALQFYYRKSGLRSFLVYF